MKTSPVLKLGALLVLAGLAAFALLGRPPVATVAAVKRGLAVNAVPATVAVRADYEMGLSSENGGRVKSSLLVVGGRVRAGEVVVQLDDTDLRIELDRLKKDRQAAQDRKEAKSANEVALEIARDKQDRIARQAAAGTAAAADLDDAKHAVQQLEQTVTAEKTDRQNELDDLESKLRQQERLVEKAAILAPADGQVDTVLAHPGDLVAPGAVLGTLMSAARVVEASISEENYSGVAVGQRATVTFLGYGVEKFEATVATVLPTSDPATQRYTVWLDVKIEPGRLVPGLSGEATVILGDHAGALLAPRRALLGDYVLVVRDGRVEQRRVQRGFASMQEVELVSGVAEGELIITDNLDAFHPGDRVRVAQP